MRHIEDALQMAVIEYLKYAGTNLLYLHPANGGKRNAREGARFKRMGVLPGAADLLIFWRGGMGAIELKSPDGRQSPAQSNFQHNWQYMGGQYAICRSIEEVQAVLKLWGAICPQTKIIPPAYALNSVSKYTAKPRGKK